LEVLRAFKWLEFFSETATIDYTKSPLHNIVAYFETKLIFKVFYTNLHIGRRKRCSVSLECDKI
jgi:hypothetical protein